MKPIDAVLSFSRRFAFSSVTLSKEKWLVNWFCCTIAKRTSFCIPDPSSRVPLYAFAAALWLCSAFRLDCDLDGDLAIRTPDSCRELRSAAQVSAASGNQSVSEGAAP